MFTNPRTVPTVKTVKYCTRPDPEAEVTTEAAVERLRLRPGPGGQRQTPVQSLVPPAQQEIQVRDKENSDLRDICEYTYWFKYVGRGNHIIVDNASACFNYETS